MLPSVPLHLHALQSDSAVAAMVMVVVVPLGHVRHCASPMSALYVPRTHGLTPAASLPGIAYTQPAAMAHAADVSAPMIASSVGPDPGSVVL